MRPNGFIPLTRYSFTRSYILICKSWPVAPCIIERQAHHLLITRSFLKGITVAVDVPSYTLLISSRGYGLICFSLVMSAVRSTQVGIECISCLASVR
jgi:hypothetical protein